MFIKCVCTCVTRKNREFLCKIAVAIPALTYNRGYATKKSKNKTCHSKINVLFGKILQQLLTEDYFSRSIFL